MLKHSLLSVLLLFSSQWVYAATETAILAGGCFWCSESDFEKITGVTDVVSGYSGGHVKNPTYKEVSSGSSGHIEVVKVDFNPDVISYETILHKFWRTIDPTNNRGQFCDHGPQYRPAVFPQNAQQETLVRASLTTLDKEKPFPDAVKVDVLPTAIFYPAEDYHQNYYKTHSIRYKYYRYACGRDKRLENLWGET